MVGHLAIGGLVTVWVAVIAASLSSLLLKVLGFTVPARWLARPSLTVAITLVPVALLSALVMTQTFSGDSGRPTLDARALGLAVALVAVWRRVNFLVVLVAAAAVTALARRAGMS